MLAFRYAALPELEKQLVRAELSVNELNTLDSLLFELTGTMLGRCALTKDNYQKTLVELNQSLIVGLSGWDRLIAECDLPSKKLPARLLKVINDVVFTEKNERTYEF